MFGGPYVVTSAPPQATPEVTTYAPPNMATQPFSASTNMATQQVSGGYPEAEAQALFNTLDVNRDGGLSREEFAKLWTQPQMTQQPVTTNQTSAVSYGAPPPQISQPAVSSAMVNTCGTNTSTNGGANAYGTNVDMYGN